MTNRTQHEVGHRLDAAAAACLHSGARLTPLRRDLLALVLAAEGPATAYQLLERLRATHPGAAPPTVYRTLDFLLAQRLIHRVERLNAFVACSEAEQHDHAASFLICGRCGTVAELEDHDLSEAVRGAARHAGFRPSAATVEIEGLCAQCVQAGPARA